MRLIVDGNNLTYRVYRNNTHLTTSKGVSVSVIYGFINSLRSIIHKFKPQEVIVVWDGKPVIRKEIYEGYKARRHSVKTPQEQEEYREVYLPQAKSLLSLLSAFGVYQYKIEDVEADDIIGVLSKEKEAVIISEDKDFLQLVNLNVSVYRPIAGEFYDVGNFESKIGLTPLQFLYTRVLMGDSTDEIDGIKGIGEKRAFDLIKKYSTLDCMLKDEAGLKKSKITANIIDSRDLIIRNMLLMDLRLSYAYVPAPIRQFCIEGKLDEQGVKKGFMKYEFFSFLTKYQNFMSPFRMLN